MLAETLAVLIAIASQSPRDPGCNEWRQCRTMALAAADRGEYEMFHDLAWRAVQTGPARDAGLMFLLARAQALSGRPHDALVMLDRLAQMGVPSDVDANDDFARTRQLPGWPDVAARIERLRGVAPPVAPAPAPGSVKPVVVPDTPNRPTAAAPPPSPRPSPPPIARTEAIRFSTDRTTVAGLAYDVASGRLLFADATRRKIVAVSERLGGASQASDLVRADSAGFRDIRAIDIDDKRGDLWVTSAADDEGAGTLHRLQLVSGRPLKAFRIPPGAAPVDLVDVAITRGGSILVLDAANGRVVALRPGASDVERVMRVDVPAPASLAAGGDEAVAYVAHRDGVSRIDLRTRTAAPLVSPKDVSLAGLRWIRWHRNALIGVTGEAASSRIVRFDLTGDGRAVRRATPVEDRADIAERASMTITGDDLVYLTPVGETAAGAEFVVYRVHLR